MTDLSEETQLAIIEIRDLLRLLAEPAIADRDRRYREELKAIVGKSHAKQKSVLLMDGTRTQSQIRTETEVNQGHLSTLVKQLSNADLVQNNDGKPKLRILIPGNFFDEAG